MVDPKPTFTYLVSEIIKRQPGFAYIHVIEPRVNGNMERIVLDGEVRVVRGASSGSSDK